MLLQHETTSSFSSNDKIRSITLDFIFHSNNIEFLTMTSLTFFVTILLHLFVHTTHLHGFPCHDCNPFVFDRIISVDELPVIVNRTSCVVMESSTGCFTSIQWHDDSKTIVLYGTNPNPFRDTVEVHLKRKLFISMGTYNTSKYIVYTCGTSESIPCNTMDKLKRSILSTTFPTRQQTEQYDSWISPSSTIIGFPCFVGSNLTDCAAGSDFNNCSQCFGVTQSAQVMNVCGTCASDDYSLNELDYQTIFDLNDRTRSDTITIRCQSDRCNTIENMQKIRQTWVNLFNFNTFFSSTGTTKTLSFVILTLSISMTIL